MPDLLYWRFLLPMHCALGLLEHFFNQTEREYNNNNYLAFVHLHIIDNYQSSQECHIAVLSCPLCENNFSFLLSLSHFFNWKCVRACMMFVVCSTLSTVYFIIFVFVFNQYSLNFLKFFDTTAVLCAQNITCVNTSGGSLLYCVPTWLVCHDKLCFTTSLLKCRLFNCYIFYYFGYSWCLVVCCFPITFHPLSLKERKRGVVRIACV